MYMHSKLKSLLFSTALLLSIPAASMADENIYLSIAAGVNILEDSKIDSGVNRFDTENDLGGYGSAAVGYDFGNALRGEVEFAYRANDFDTVGNVASSDDSSAWSLMGNLLYDFHNKTKVTPYLGFGLGAITADFKSVDLPSSDIIDDTASSVAVQGIAGADMSINDRTSVFVKYNRLSAIDLEFTSNLGDKYEVEYDENIFAVGLRFDLGQKGSAVAMKPQVNLPVVPAVPKVSSSIISEPRSYMVFFNFDKSSLTHDAKSILKQVAGSTDDGEVTRIKVTGHADRSGSESYNMQLSKYRALMVKKELMRLGVDKREIVMFAKGEHELLKLTEDGIREPQNRRVEILYNINK